MSLKNTELRKVKRVCVAKIAQTHGVRGLVKLFLYAENTDLIGSSPLYTDKTGTDTLKLTLKNSMGKYWLAEIEGATDKETAETYRGTELWIDREHLPDLDDAEDEFYYEDLKGLNVQNESGKTIGTIMSVDNFGAGDLLDIKPAQGASFYLPFTKENVPEINLDTGFITVLLPEELLNEE